MYRGGGAESPGYYSSAPTGQKGRPRKRKLPPGPESPASTDMPVSMRMTASSLGKLPL